MSSNIFQNASSSSVASAAPAPPTVQRSESRCLAPQLQADSGPGQTHGICQSNQNIGGKCCLLHIKLISKKSQIDTSYFYPDESNFVEVGGYLTRCRMEHS